MAIATGPLAASEPEFELEVGPLTSSNLGVLLFEADEELSRPFSLEVTLVVHPDTEIDAPALIGEPAVLTIQHGDGTARFVHGLVAQVKFWEEGRGDHRRRCCLRVVPALWRLSQVRRCRVFQELSVPDIVKQVLDEGRVAFRTALSASYGPREYCVQYNESNLDFVSRLLEEEGIFYFFEHQADAHTLVLADVPSSCQPITGEERIVFREPSQMAPDAEHIDAFSSQAEVRPDSVALRDYNYLTPVVDLAVGHGVRREGAMGGLELYEFPGGFGDRSRGGALAKVRLEEQQVRAATASGSGLSRRLQAGYVFELDEHPEPSFNGRYLLVSVKHRGDQTELLGHGSAQAKGKRPSYRNDFVCIGDQSPFRPERRTARPVIPGPQTAVVVGPSGEEIYTDEHGRVKVQFHWDREGRKDERSSCWIRVSQAWAGPGWGALYLPRLGQEVVVEFQNGDPDRPLVTGAVYNGLNLPPLPLPEEKTKSTLRSASSPGGDGFNELRFEDQKDAEEIYLHAQRDLNLVVENDKSQRVGGNERLVVSKDRSRQVGGSQSLQVARDDSSTIQGNQSLAVGMSRTTTVGGAHRETVGGDQSVNVGATQAITVALAASETVALAKALNVGGAYAVTVGAAMNELVGGLKSEEVGGAKVEVVGAQKSETVAGSRSLHVGGDLSETVGGGRTLRVSKDLVLNVSGNFAHAAQQGYTLESPQEIVVSAGERFLLRVGSATIEVKKGGEVVIQGSQVDVSASGALTLKGSAISEN